MCNNYCSHTVTRMNTVRKSSRFEIYRVDLPHRKTYYNNKIVKLKKLVMCNNYCSHTVPRMNTV